MVRAFQVIVSPVVAQDLFLASKPDGYDVTHQVMHSRLQHMGLDVQESHRLSHSMASRQMQHVMETDWILKEEHVYVNEDGLEIVNSTYQSPTFKLKTGEAHFTLNPLYRMPCPAGDYMGLHNSYRVVRGDGDDQVPLSELYLHHWLVGTQDHVDPLHYCEGDFFWGYGAEMRGMDYDVPAGYGAYRIGAKGYCGANLHFINTQDLKTHWHGLNNPKGDHGAAVKNCIECGWAPMRAPECLERLDGTFACCFTGARCPVNNPFNRSTQHYSLQYNLVWTRKMNSGLKPVHGLVLDVSGGSVEWNIAPNKTGKDNTHCDDKVCVTSNSWTVGTTKGFGHGICAGTMMWGYLHQHVGAINGTLYVNGKQHCASYPHVGTDPNNSPGNEKGFVVKFSECVNNNKFGNKIRLNAGDVVHVDAFYDVDTKSTVNLPLPGGKHGGVMALYFAMMDCDPGTFGEVYVCRQGTCIPTYENQGKNFTTHWKALSDCKSHCI